MWMTKFKTISLAVCVAALLSGVADFWLHFALAQPSAPAPRSAKPVDPAQVKADKPVVVKGNTAFACDLYAKLRGQEGNLFCSPYSISTALAMTYTGARTQTADQMAKTLHFSLEQGRLHPAFAALQQELAGDGKKRGYQLQVANALWGQLGYPFKNDFLDTTRANYGGAFQPLDFKNNPEQARQTINTWVEKQTQDKIKGLLRKGIIKTNTRMVLTNAIYFKGDWAAKFKKEFTRDEPFHQTATQKVNTPLMHRTGKYRYLDGGDFQALQMPYTGDDLSMVVLLPKKVDGLADFEKTLTPAKLADWLPKLREQTVVVSLPKFKMTSEFTLNDQLSAMGMPLAFDEDKADFKGIADVSNENLHISKVIHKAFVDVNEEGTEAAAATAVIIAAPTSAPIQIAFRADHPFVFLIRDNRSGSILFLGRLANPKGQ